MIQCLRQSLLYSDKRMRDILFRAVKETIEESNRAGQKLSVAQLGRKIATAGRTAGKASELEPGNWDMTSKAVVNTMVRAGVLLDPDGSVVSPGVGADAAPVAGVVDGFERLCEAFLLEFLIVQLGDVSMRDHKALAHALFRQFDTNIPIEDLEDQVAALLSTLQGSVHLSETGAYTVPDNKPPRNQLTQSTGCA